MNTEIVDQKTQLDVIFPEARSVTIARAGATEPETIQIYPLPLQKWKQGFKYIAQIAPLLGFDLFGGTMTAEQIGESSGADLMEKAQALSEGKTDVTDQPIDTQKIYDALLGEGSDVILEFIAFAIDKDVAFLDGLYDEIIDIMVAVIELNLNFFVQKLLPKVLAGTRNVVATAQQVRTAAQK